MNGDGKPDLLVTAGGRANVGVLLNMTAPGATTTSFVAEQTFATGSSPHRVITVDVNGDGKPDLIVGNYGSGSTSVLLNTTIPGATTLSFTSQQTFAVGSDPYSLAAVDLNGDGKPDLCVVNKTSASLGVLLNLTPAGATVAAFAPQHTFLTAAQPTSVAAADINGDGKPDLIIGIYSKNTS